jgi:hypothetical protein
MIACWRARSSLRRSLGTIASVAGVATALLGCKGSPAPPAQETRDLSRFRSGGSAYFYPSAVPGFSEAKIPGLAVRFAVARVPGRSPYSDTEAEAVRRTYGRRLALAGYDVLVVHMQVSQPFGVLTVTNEYERTKSGQFAKPGTDERKITDVVASYGI